MGDAVLNPPHPTKPQPTKPNRQKSFWENC